ncbi:MAG: glycerophosphoryl diester phosphodiesterase membrane domain-containing protein, partial [Parasphingorhabdus sp.]
NLLTGLLVLPGLFLFVLPGAYIWARLVLAPVVIADRGERNPVGAIKQSWSLTQNNGFSILLFILIIAVTGTITIGAVQAVVGIIVGLATGGAGWPFIENLVASLTGTAFQLVLAVIIMSVYLELTGKKRDVTEVFN